MNARWIMTAAVIGVLAVVQGGQAEGNSRLGGGVNFWTAVDDIDDRGIDDNGTSWLISYQHRIASLLRVEADLEVFPSDFMGIHGTVTAPQAYLVVGMGIYAALGTGILYSDGDFADELFYALRAGIELEILTDMYLDLNVNYRFADGPSMSEIGHDIDGDTMTLGAALRLEF
ncbi:MAG TPA: hypothetical protein DCS43_10925 [Verrucomicrobia bacterium]|nr:hypothetical protein [Verrucomicrobiota bacterium]